MRKMCHIQISIISGGLYKLWVGYRETIWKTVVELHCVSLANLEPDFLESLLLCDSGFDLARREICFEIGR
jgi:hypothetical protein